MLFKKGHTGYWKNKKHSVSTRKKMSDSHKGKNTWSLGSTHSSSTKKKMSDSHLGKIPWNKGKKVLLSKKARSAMSKAWKGKKRSPFSVEHRRKISQRQKGNIASIESRRKMSESHKGAKSNFWKGGISSINVQIRGSLEYKLWREAVFKRDNWTCVWCEVKFIKGETGRVMLNADHIRPFALFPELRFDVNNGRTLCVPCHKTTDTYLGKTRSKHPSSTKIGKSVLI